MNRCKYSRMAPPGRATYEMNLLGGFARRSHEWARHDKKQVHQCKHKLNEAIFTSKATYSILHNCSTATKRMLGNFPGKSPPTKFKILDRAGWVHDKRVDRSILCDSHALLPSNESKRISFWASSAWPQHESPKWQETMLRVPKQP